MAELNRYQNEVVVLPVTWANGQTVSGAVDLGGLALLGVYVPASFEGTALTLQRYITTKAGYVTVTGWTLTVAADQFAYVSSLAAAQMGSIKLVSDQPTGAERVGEIHAVKVV